MKKIIYLVIILAIVFGGVYLWQKETQPSSYSSDWAIEQVKNNPQAQVFISEMEAKNYSPRASVRWDSQNDEFVVIIDSKNVMDYAASFRVKPNGVVTEITGEQG